MKLLNGSLLTAAFVWGRVAVAQPAPPAPQPPVAQPAAPAPGEPGQAAPPAAPAPGAVPALPPAEGATEPAPAAVPPAAAAPVEAAPAAQPPEAAPPKQLAVGKEGLFQPGALLQFWLWNVAQDDDNELSFRVRRAELRIKGQIVPDLVAYQIMIDPARALEFEETELPVEGQDPEPAAPGTVTVDQPNGATSIFQDFNIGFLSEYADVTLGQFKIPVSYEGFNSSSKILFPERALVARRYGDRRDIGARVDKKFDYFYYNVGVYNGSGQNRLDNDDQKDLALRLEGYPVEGLTVGAVGYMGLVDRDTADTKDRVEADLRVEMFDALLLAEYIHGWDGPTDGDRLEGHGFYVAGGYTFLERIQPIVRIGRLDADVDSDASGSNDEVWHYEGGLNYYLRGPEARVALTASVFDFDDAPTRTEVILLAQAGF